jgi:transposase-like protein
VQRFMPLLADAARFARHAPGDRWFVDETYVKVNGVWRYVYRAIDQDGHRGLVDAIGATLGGRRGNAAARIMRNLLGKVPRSAQPWVATMVRTIFDQPDPASVRDQTSPSAVV